MCSKDLPAGYVLHEEIDLQKNKKQFWLVNGISVALIVLMCGIGCLIEDPLAAFDEVRGSEGILASVVILVAVILYPVFHELTHGVFLYVFTKVRPKFGFVGWAAYCGNSAYCDKPHYLIVALAPVIFWGIVFGILNIFFPTGIWFWVIWFLQLFNISGASGDFYVTYKILRAPKDILVTDSGMRMLVYRKDENIKNMTENEASMSETYDSEEEKMQ